MKRVYRIALPFIFVGAVITAVCAQQANWNFRGCP